MGQSSRGKIIAFGPNFMDGFLTISHWLQGYTDSKVTSGQRTVDWILFPSFPPTYPSLPLSCSYSSSPSTKSCFISACPALWSFLVILFCWKDVKTKEHFSKSSFPLPDHSWAPGFTSYAWDFMFSLAIIQIQTFKISQAARHAWSGEGCWIWAVQARKETGAGHSQSGESYIPGVWKTCTYSSL